ncbi:hypothetical protein CEY16_03080 [Halalkalibacillus sediminis]|uniref:2'-5' RNA ligase n=1 Tax=Halalkalibacillus sediminis TaxID=2018042 RepID=A0A2I0QWQ7_9BACI|nr:2'-5' RNA ligase family protein [Halalkalibacillus sediminis]PKR78754.1 hypothetical protein CEY16_03080 [Halalkalibacillus sediminis]
MWGWSSGNFNNATYIVLDIPENIADKVKDIRSEYDYTMSLPVEITIAGSSGLGALQYEQNPHKVFQTLRDITSGTKPIITHFDKVRRFNNTDIFFFTLQDENPIREIHQQLVKSNINYSESSFPFNPHCTLCNNSSLNKVETDELLSKEIEEEFIIDALSVYTLDRKSSEDINVNLLKRFQLSGK